VENFWRVNTLGGLLCAREALPDMLAAATGDAAPDQVAQQRAGSLAAPLTGLHRGTILFTGASASLRCLAGLTSMSIGKFGLRALAQGMAREFAPRGVHVAHVIVDGAVDSPLLRSYIQGQLAKPASQSKVEPLLPGASVHDRFLQPAAVANEYFHLHEQHISAWSQEIDLRPHTEPILARL